MPLSVLSDHPTNVHSRPPTLGLATDLRSSRLSSPSARSLLGHQRSRHHGHVPPSLVVSANESPALRAMLS